jgi:hypothetical protein
MVTVSLLGILAAILVIIGVVKLIQGELILGIVLLVLAAVIGPGGYTIFR